MSKLLIQSLQIPFGQLILTIPFQHDGSQGCFLNGIFSSFSRLEKFNKQFLVFTLFVCQYIIHQALYIKVTKSVIGYLLVFLILHILQLLANIFSQIIHSLLKHTVGHNGCRV